MTVLKKNINLHPFTAPSADTNTAAPESNGAGGKEGGEKLRISPPIFHAFSCMLRVYYLIAIGDYDTSYLESLYDSLSHFLPDDEDTPTDRVIEIEREYHHFLKLGEIYSIIPNDDKYTKYTIQQVIQEKAYKVADLLSDEYPILKPILDAYTDF